MRESPTRSELAWRCRRGTRELELLLLGWLDRRFEGASEAERAGFAALLELPDPELMRHLLAGEVGPGSLLAAAARAAVEAAASTAAPGRTSALAAAHEAAPAAVPRAQPPSAVLARNLRPVHGSKS